MTHSCSFPSEQFSDGFGPYHQIRLGPLYLSAQKEQASPLKAFDEFFGVFHERILRQVAWNGPAPITVRWGEPERTT